MNIRERLRKALLMEGSHKSKYGCVMVFLKYKESEWNGFLNVIDDEDLYDPKDETGYGKETEPHITILYGLHSDIPDEDVSEEIEKIKKPEIKLGKVTCFENEKFDVLKFDIESEDLHKLNKKFQKFPFTSDFPKYHPHCTIAYVKKGVAKKYMDKLNNVDKIKVEPEKIVYSKSNDEKKHYKL